MGHSVCKGSPWQRHADKRTCDACDSCSRCAPSRGFLKLYLGRDGTPYRICSPCHAATLAAGTLARAYVCKGGGA